MTVYVFDSGEVRYKRDRSLQDQKLHAQFSVARKSGGSSIDAGCVREIQRENLAGAVTIDCEQIRGRSDLQWQHEI